MKMHLRKSLKAGFSCSLQFSMACLSVSKQNLPCTDSEFKSKSPDSRVLGNPA